VRELTAILQETIGLLSRARHGFDQQMCESFNALKAKFASKDISWGVSWPIRVMCAILQMNSETDWRVPLAVMCGVTVDEELLQFLENSFRKEKALNRERRTAEAQKKAREYRRLARQREKAESAGRHDYHIASEDSDEADGAEDAAVPEWMTNDDAVRWDERIAVRHDHDPEAIETVRQILEPIVRNRDYQGSNAPQPRRPIDAMEMPALPPPPRFGPYDEIPEDLPEAIETSAPPWNRFSDGSLIQLRPTEAELNLLPRGPFNPLPEGSILAVLERARAGTLAEQERINETAEEEEALDDAEDEEVAGLPEADRPITDEHFVFRMQDKTLVMEPR
jgi:hypothetical protein